MYSSNGVEGIWRQVYVWKGKGRGMDLGCVVREMEASSVALHFFSIPHTATERKFNCLFPSLSALCMRAGGRGKERERETQ